jgi:predicted nucleotidyltransferase
MPARQGERRETKVWPPAHLEELLRRAGKILRDAGAEEVYVFGSAATGQMHERSDIDLAVQGLPPRRFIRAMLKAEDIFDRPVDLVELSDDTPFTRYLVRGGKLRRVA